MNLKKFLALALLTAFTLILGIGVTAAQDSITISVKVPIFQRDLFEQTIIPQFEAENPGIKVHIIGTEFMGAPFGPNQAIEEYLDQLAEHASEADVFMMDSISLTSEATRTGYLLDLAPLANTDASLNLDDYFPAMLRSVQWDGGLWALPISTSVVTLFYDPAAFDAAGLAYPDENWTMDDLVNAARTLTVYNPDGTVDEPGLLNLTGDLPLLMQAMHGDDVINDTVLPAIPDYANPALESLVTEWAALIDEGIINYAMGEFNSPMQLSPSFFMNPNQGRTLTPVRLPGGTAINNITSFAVSGGTLYPEAAYKLAKFLTMNADTSNAFFGSSPARRSLVNATSSPNAAGIVFRQENLSPEIRAVIDAALENGLAGSNVRFMRDIERAIENMNANDIDARTALNELEMDVLNRLQAGDARRAQSIVVEAPPAEVVLAPGEISLNFGVGSVLMPSPYESAWRAAADEFAAQDAEVGYVDTESAFPGSYTVMSQQYDCYYLPNNIIAYSAVESLLSLDPLMQADPNFNRDDLLAGVLQQLQQNGQTWGYPMNIIPLSMRYNRQLFEQAGAVVPAGATWDVQQFEEALRLLKQANPEAIPYVPTSFDAAYLLALIAGYGGLPIDFRTTPPTINMTDTATVEAVRQVLDLAKNGYLDYQPLGRDRGGTLMINLGASNPLYNEFGGFGSFMVFASGGVGSDNPLPVNQDGLVMFPAGSQYTPITYDVGAGYISASTQHAEACYRFMSFVAGRTGLMGGIPASRTLMNSPEFLGTLPPDSAAYYQAVDAALSQPNTIAMPAISPIGSTSTTLLWLSRAFDRYVLDDADLVTELAEAESYTRAFVECVAGAPIDDPMAIRDCALQVDPDISALMTP